MMTKTESMRPVFAGFAHEIFEEQNQGLFDITAMRQAARNGRYGGVHHEPLVPQHARYFVDNRSHELQRCSDLLMDPAAPWLDDPALALYDQSDDSHTFVDGVHRILCRWMLKLPDFIYWRVPIDKAIRPEVGSFHMKLNFDWGDTIVTPEGLRKR